MKVSGTPLNSIVTREPWGTGSTRNPLTQLHPWLAAWST